MNPGLKNITLLFLAVTVLTVYPGCTPPRKPSANSRHFIIELEDNTTRSNRTIEGTIRIHSFHISSPFQSTELVYRLGDAHYESDYYNRFIVSPSTIITEQAQRWIAQSGLFENVAPSTSRAFVNFSLEGDILSFYADLRNNQKPLSFMEIRFVIVNEIQAKNSIIFNKTYQASTPIESIEPSKIIAGYKQSLENILNSFLSDVEKLDFPTPPAF